MTGRGMKLMILTLEASYSFIGMFKKSFIWKLLTFKLHLIIVAMCKGDLEEEQINDLVEFLIYSMKLASEEKFHLHPI
jgi:hypothetical protein